MSGCKLVTIKHNGHDSAILFIHGGGGDPLSTWGEFPQFLAQASLLSKWDVFSLGYESNLIHWKDWLPVHDGWPFHVFARTDPSMNALAGWLHTATSVAPLKQYQDLAIITHSLGGLIAQRAVLDHPALAARISHLFLFGVSSNGFRKYPLINRMPQLREIVPGGVFIENLRKDWTAKFVCWKPPFKYFVVVGTEDGWVDTDTAITGFPIEVIHFVPGDHLEIVRLRSKDHPSLNLVVDEVSLVPVRYAPMHLESLRHELREFKHHRSLAVSGY